MRFVNLIIAIQNNYNVAFVWRGNDCVTIFSYTFLRTIFFLLRIDLRS